MPQRIRAGCDEGSYGNGKSLSSLPQRIRAGCDRQQTRTNQLQKRFASAHSRGLRHVRPIRRRSSDPFATAHSRGLRPASHLKAGITRFFATAHSRGLRRFDNPQKEVDIVLCHSAFARVATQPLRKVNQPAVPLPQRIRAGCDNHDKKAAGNGYSLPQRIRAGCDTEGDTDKAEYLHFATAHSCGLRRAKAKHTKATHGLCHSAFVRVATRVRTSKCGRTCRSLPQRIRAGCDAQKEGIINAELTLPQRIRAGCDVRKSCMLLTSSALPQRIRAGCDCGKAMQRTANLLREGR